MHATPSKVIGTRTSVSRIKQWLWQVGVCLSSETETIHVPPLMCLSESLFRVSASRDAECCYNLFFSHPPTQLVKQGKQPQTLHETKVALNYFKVSSRGLPYTKYKVLLDPSQGPPFNVLKGLKTLRDRKVIYGVLLRNDFSQCYIYCSRLTASSIPT